MKKKQVLAVSFALMIGTTTALTGVSTPVMAQKNTDVQENIIDKEQEKTTPNKASTENTETSKGDLTEEKSKEEVIAENIAIDEVHFPDVEFRRYIEEKIDKNKDNILSADDINQVTIISNLGSDIRNFQGIEFFTSLRFLAVANLKVSTLETINNPNLRTLHCMDCSELKTIDANPLPCLEELWVSSCEKVENITLEKCVNLKN